MFQEEQLIIDWGNPSAKDFRTLKDAIHDFPAVIVEYGAIHSAEGWEVFLAEKGGEDAYDISATLAPLIGLPGKMLPLQGPEEAFQIIKMVATCDLVGLKRWMASIQAELAEINRKSN